MTGGKAFSPSKRVRGDVAPRSRPCLRRRAGEAHITVMISYLANPERFMRISRPVAIGCGALAAGLIGWAMYEFLLVSCRD